MVEEINQKLKERTQLTLRLVTKFCLVLAFLAFMPSTAKALNLISDEETELFLQKITQPLFTAAGIPFNRNNIFIVNDSSLNAFVSDGNKLFIHTGTIIAADNSDEIVGVIAHETGHIMGGHIILQKIKDKELQKASLASIILAGTTAAVSGRGDVAMAIALGGQSSTLNNFLQYRTEQERSADESAVKLLNKTNQSPLGVLNFMKRIRKTNEMSGVVEDPYFRTHPITSERISFMQQAVKNSPLKTESTEQEQFKKIKAKLIAFLQEPRQTLRLYPLTNQSKAARYAQSIAYFKELDIENAIAKIDSLIKEEPQNPFYKELKGQIYMETGQIKPAKQQYQQALNALPNSALLQLNLAQAILEDNPSAEELKKTVNMLNQASIKQPTPMGWLLLSRAYGALGDETYSNYTAAEYSMSLGLPKIAKQQLEMASKNVGNNAKLKLKIDDLKNRVDEWLKDK